MFENSTAQSTQGRGTVWHPPQSGDSRPALSRRDCERGLARWLYFCSLDQPDSSAARVSAAVSDFQQRATLQRMMVSDALACRDWWQGQDPTGYELTRVTGSDDWAYIALALICEQSHRPATACGAVAASATLS